MDGETGLSADVFDPLTNETRVAILRALADEASETPADPWVEYTDLRDAVGIRDNGNFNYHLDRLGEFVEKRPAGYRLSHVGMVAVTTMAAGGFDADWTWGPVDAPGECLFCGRPVELRYEDGACWLACGDEDHAMALSASPRLLAGPPDDGDREALFERVAFADHRWAESTRRGICSECRGHVAGRIERGGVQPDHYHYRGRCRGCGFQHGVPLGLFVASHPSVVAFCHDHGVDVRTTPFWTLAWCRPGTETVCSEDPLRLQVDLCYGDDRLSLTVAEDGSVVETTLG